jgi:frataxin-like iron-binding protein CyaY
MSEAIVVNTIKLGVSAVRFMFTLGKKVREMNNMACQRASIQKFQQAGLDVSSTAKLTGLNQALKTESLSPLLNRTMPNISQSTIDTISSLERFSIGNTPNIKISQADISNALSDLTNGVQIANEAIMIEEQKKVVDDLNIVLHNRGYEIQNQTLPSKEIWVKANKGDKVLAAKVHPSSEMAIDLAGFHPGECTEERKAIMADMEKLGYQFDIKKQIAHNRRDGGEIIKHINKEFSKLDERLSRMRLVKTTNSRRMRG